MDQKTGWLASVWYDARNAAANNKVEVWGTGSIDGGVTWAPNFKISQGLTSYLSSTNGGDPNECGDWTARTEKFRVLFKRQLDLHQTTVAMGEAVAHLHALAGVGKLLPVTGDDGVLRYRTDADRARLRRAKIQGGRTENSVLLRQKNKAAEQKTLFCRLRHRSPWRRLLCLPSRVTACGPVCASTLRRHILTTVEGRKAETPPQAGGAVQSKTGSTSWRSTPRAAS